MLKLCGQVHQDFLGSFICTCIISQVLSNMSSCHVKKEAESVRVLMESAHNYSFRRNDSRCRFLHFRRRIGDGDYRTAGTKLLSKVTVQTPFLGVASVISSQAAYLGLTTINFGTVSAVLHSAPNVFLFSLQQKPFALLFPG